MHAYKTKLIDITVIICHHTDRAVYADFGGKEPVWLPLSQIEISPNEDNSTHTLTLPEWLAREKGMI